ncbi:MAG: mammalian cell entry protein [Rhodanobacter sp. 68-29]|nr:MCE family protein [Rhodanobacter sp.]ODU74502.1 MAG: mammalian cell entry protein [Rhodanobacter sp. SCN 69-32]OJY61035.1 MAG: mammalian cell entry protein [Rhodanobacter sp. 68-29]
MTDEKSGAPQPMGGGELPRTVVRKRRTNASLIWLVPILAAVVGVSLVVNSWLQAGPGITITFQSAQGLAEGKTPVKYKDVVIGKVDKIRLSGDRSHVLVKVALDKSAKAFATRGTRYWVVRPRIGLGGVSGVDTLFSGAYIGADTGDSSEPEDEFKGLENPPAVTHGEPGKSYTLHADDLGSLDIGSAVYFRRIQVGQVVSYQLDKDGQGVSLQVFIDSPYDRFVGTATRFWNASGVDVSLGANGLKLNTQSLATVLAGGVAFQDPPGPHDTTAAADGASFRLFNDVTTAMAPPDGEPHYIRMRFDQSLRGLAVGAPVEFLGVNFGKVVSIRMDYDEKTQRFPLVVGAIVYPDRLGQAHDKLVALAKQRGDNADISHMVGKLVEHGLRAQARTGNLLTGQLYIAMDFLPHAAKVRYDPDLRPLEIPTAPGSFDKLQEQMASIVGKLDKIPFDQIGNHLNDSLASLDATLKQVNGKTLPSLDETMRDTRKTLGTANDTLSSDSPVQQNLGVTLQEVQRTMRSLRVLTDYLGVHPESLLRGRQADPVPAAPKPAAAPATPANRSQP